MVDGGVADPDRLRTLVTGKVIECLLGRLLAAVNGVPKVEKEKTCQSSESLRVRRDGRT